MLEGVLSFFYKNFSLHLFSFIFTWSFSVYALEFSPQSLSMHRDRRGSLHQLTKMDFRLPLLSISLHSAECSLMCCQIRQNTEENTASEQWYPGENPWLGATSEREKPGKNGEGRHVPEIIPNCLFWRQGAIQKVITKLEKNKHILRIRKSGYAFSCCSRSCGERAKVSSQETSNLHKPNMHGKGVLAHCK